MDLNLSPREKILLTAALCVALVVAWNQFLLQPLLASVNDLNDTIVQRQGVLDQRRGWAERDNETKAAIVRLEGEIQELSARVNTLSSERDLLNFIAHASTVQPVQISGISVSTDRLSLTCTSNGYENTRLFIRLLETSPNLRITSATVNTGNGFNFSVNIQAEVGFGSRPPGAGERYNRSVPFN